MRRRSNHPQSELNQIKPLRKQKEEIGTYGNSSIRRNSSSCNDDNLLCACDGVRDALLFACAGWCHGCGWHYSDALCGGRQHGDGARWRGNEINERLVIGVVIQDELTIKDRGGLEE